MEAISISNNPNGLGISSCSYVGAVHVDCGSENVSIPEIPNECTAIIFDGFNIDSNNQVNGPSGEDNLLDELDLLLKSSKNVFILYGHETEEDWAQVLATEISNNATNSTNEMKGLKPFLDKHPGIKGLLINNLELDANSVDFPKYSENFKVYLDTMRSNFPNMSIGLLLVGKFIVDQYTKPKLTWLNFTIIDPSVDFYMISVVTFNECTDQFRLLGTAPIGVLTSKNNTGSTNSSSNGSTNLTMPVTNYTLSNLRDILVDLSVPKNKTYYRYRLGPLSNDDTLDGMCASTVNKICLNSTDSSSWCYETLDSFNAKGKFANDNGAGFVVNIIKLDDPKNDCKCGPYPSFNAILDGFNGKNTNITKECALSNRS
ncbi:uncharacterized protein LOC113558397 [Rhopalosiphum maidis]|uniref:uncharacterized protein LOC113558397 n=1 Tax=Rhopalosiphum maidis TaxID=43146 RepID=UPI000EFE9C68|nr:uncharacterized protein LOC113558397 [Rhopalosiphum maidis]